MAAGFDRVQWEAAHLADRFMWDSRSADAPARMSQPKTWRAPPRILDLTPTTQPSLCRPLGFSRVPESGTKRTWPGVDFHSTSTRRGGTLRPARRADLPRSCPAFRAANSRHLPRDTELEMSRDRQGR